MTTERLDRTEMAIEAGQREMAELRSTVDSLVPIVEIHRLLLPQLVNISCSVAVKLG